MIEVTTRCNDQELKWRVEITVAQRQELHRREAIFIMPLPDGSRQIVVRTHELLEVIAPEAIADVTIGDQPRPAGDLMEWMWGLPMMHLDTLATQVGVYIYTGIEPGAEAEEDEDGPLAAASGSAGTATRSTPDASPSAEAATASPTTEPCSAG